MYHIGILTTLWKRHDLESIVLEYYRQMDIDGIVFHRVAVGSEGACSRFVAECADWHYIEADNNPLSDKWNVGMEYLKGRVDAVLIVGSDDILNRRAVSTLVAEWTNGADVVALEDLFYYDSERDELYHSDRAHPGAGMLIGQSALMRVSWRPWPSGHNVRLDGAVTNYLTQNAYPCKFKYIDHCADKGVVLVDIKSCVNMWSIKEMAETTNRVVQVDPSEMDTEFPGLRGLLKKHHKPMR